MNRPIFIILLLIVVCGLLFVSIPSEIDTSDYLRIHIRANSNSDIDQDIKYMIKGEVVKLLSPKLEGVKSYDRAKRIVLDNMDNINNVANKVLYEHGFDYRASARLDREKFPVRHYGNITLEEGVYDALIVDLGSGKGDNWWCVVFPPLCFVESESIGEKDFRYVSKIAELIDRWKK